MQLRRAEMRKIRDAYDAARDALLAEQTPEGYWVGELSSSALATATAVSALSVASPDSGGRRITSALRWLESDQNADGGWGDTPASPSNLPTTMLASAAFRLAARQGFDPEQECRDRAEAYLRRSAGVTVAERVSALRALYGADRTFAVPILANCALAAAGGAISPEPNIGQVGQAFLPADHRRTDMSGPQIQWADVPPLPFELACLPRTMFRWLRLHVVSYALPALIAIGQLVHARRPARNPLVRLLRDAAVGPSLRRLAAIQPEGGGFLEAVPLTSFVVMSLAAAQNPGHQVGADRARGQTASLPAIREGIKFIENTARADGSWPIDSNLSTWLTTMAVCALGAGPDACLPRAAATRQWLLVRQHKQRHPYTDSPPGGWAWTHLPGGVPDVDDTAGALLALARLRNAEADDAAAGGVNWLLNIQNGDRGWPTFCRGWGRLPFDRSAPDLTAHAIRAIAAWPGRADARRQHKAIARGFGYLRRSQRADGAWTALWFGNQFVSGHENPVYGTARVLAAYRELGRGDTPEARRGIAYLVRAQNADRGWGGDRGAPSSVEETALAVEALAWQGTSGGAGILACQPRGGVSGRQESLPHPTMSPQTARACLRGSLYLAERVAEGALDHASPIGLYFATLWYSEKLYPIIWTTAALGRVLSHCGGHAARGGSVDQMVHISEAQ